MILLVLSCLVSLPLSSILLSARLRMQDRRLPIQSYWGQWRALSCPSMFVVPSLTRARIWVIGASIQKAKKMPWTRLQRWRLQIFWLFSSSAGPVYSNRGLSCCSQHSFQQWRWIHGCGLCYPKAYKLKIDPTTESQSKYLKCNSCHLPIELELIAGQSFISKQRFFF